MGNRTWLTVRLISDGKFATLLETCDELPSEPELETAVMKETGLLFLYIILKFSFNLTYSYCSDAAIKEKNSPQISPVKRGRPD